MTSRSRFRRAFEFRVKPLILKRLLPVPECAGYWSYSAILPPDSSGEISERLVMTALRAASVARETQLEWLSSRSLDHTVTRWPGEHYRLLYALVKVLKPESIVEIGTGTGLSALCMHEAQSHTGRLTTFDLIGWRDFGVKPVAGDGWTRLRSALTEEDFADGRLVQEAADLTHNQTFESKRSLLASADLIFLDAAKDGVTEPALLRALDTVKFTGPALLVLDDIRVWNMVAVWHAIAKPKLDMTSFGHWTGTGLIDLSVNATDASDVQRRK